MTELNSSNLHIENCSDELAEIFEYIETELSKEIPTLILNSEYFILGVMFKKKSNAYKRLYACLRSIDLTNFQNSLGERLYRKALTAVKPGVDVKYDSAFLKIVKNALEVEMPKVNSNELTSDIILLSILNEELNIEKNLIKQALNNLGLNYNMLLDKINNEQLLKERTDELNEYMKNQHIDDDIEEDEMDDDDMEIGDVSVKVFGENGELKDAGNFSGKEGIEFLRNMVGQETLEKMGISIPKKKARKGKLKFIPQYCTNLNELVERGEIDELVGREDEVQKIVRTLGRRKKNNVVLVGGEGVGKTAIGESIAYKIVHKQLPEFLLDRIVISLDMTALMAGTTLRGMFEERVKGILDEIKMEGNFILFIDNIGQVLADKGKNDYDISSMLSHALENGEAQVIGTSDFKSFRSTFDKDPSLSRRFQKILVEAPTTADSVNILMNIKKYYENYHHVIYTQDAIKDCVYLSEKYITERNLPDSAIDIIDEAGAMISTNVKSNPELAELLENIKAKKNQMLVEKSNENFKEYDRLEAELKTLDKEYVQKKKEHDEQIANNPSVITTDTILNVISMKTGIPINKLTSDDKKKLVEINDRLKSEVIGQDEAIDTICKALKRGRVGLGTNKCLFSGMLIGKTGVGKTLIAKKLAKEMFGDEKALIRFDMSEFPDKTAVNKLIGSNPGYVGYEEGGILTEAVKNRKYCVLLLDEIEKADPEVYNIFLQVLDEGFLTDNSGMKVDFKNVIVLFTSNVGTKAASDFGKGIGFNEDTDDNSKKILLKELKKRFPPEFLNRLNNVIYFNNLTDDNLKDIIKIEVNKTQDRLEKLGFDLNVEDNVYDHILNIVKDEKEFGARPIARAIQDEIEDKITDLLLERDYDKNYIFKAYLEDNTVKVN